MERFLAILRYDSVAPAAADAANVNEREIRDVNDRPILRAARKAAVDVFVAGDKDFLESTITRPQIVTAAQFMGNL